MQHTRRRLVLKINVCDSSGWDSHGWLWIFVSHFRFARLRLYPSAENTHTRHIYMWNEATTIATEPPELSESSEWVNERAVCVNKTIGRSVVIYNNNITGDLVRIFCEYCWNMVSFSFYICKYFLRIRMFWCVHFVPTT